MASGGWFAGLLYDHFGYYVPAFAAGLIFNAREPCAGSEYWCRDATRPRSDSAPSNGVRDGGMTARLSEVSSTHA